MLFRVQGRRRSGTPRKQRQQSAFASPAAVRNATLGVQLGEFGVDERTKLASECVVSGRDLSHSRLDVSRQNSPRDTTEVDAQILDPGTVRYRKVGGDSYKHFVQCEPLRPKADELGKFESA